VDAGGCVRGVRKFGGLRGTLLEVDILLIVHKGWNGGRRMVGSGLEDCSGWGEGLVRRNIPLVQTVYILLFVVHGHGICTGMDDERSMANQLPGSDVLFGRVPVAGVGKVGGSEILPMEDKDKVGRPAVGIES